MASAFLRAVNAGWFDGYCISRKIVKIILIFMFELIIVQGMPLGDFFWRSLRHSLLSQDRPA